MSDKHLEHMFDKLHEKPEAPIQQAIDAAVPEGYRVEDAELRRGKWDVFVWNGSLESYGTGIGQTLDAAIADAVRKIGDPDD